MRPVQLHLLDPPPSPALPQGFAYTGWHRDRAVFGDVIGISFGSACRFRFRRKRGSGWERAAIALEPRSAYLLRGPARSEWEHSIPPAEALRYSVTFRSVRARDARAALIS